MAQTHHPSGTKVKVHAKGKDHHIIHCEVNGGVEGNLGTGTHEFTIGEQQSMVQYLTIKRLSAGEVKVLAETGDCYIDVDGSKAPKHIKKGHVFTMPSKAKRIVVHERPHR